MSALNRNIPEPWNLRLAVSEVPGVTGASAFWSTYYFAPGSVVAANTYRVFTTQLGAVGQGKIAPLSIFDTNIMEGNRIPLGGRISVIVVELDDGPAADLDNLRKHLTLGVEIGSSLLHLAPVGAFKWQESEGKRIGAWTLVQPEQSS